MKKHLFLFLIACLFIVTASAEDTQSFKFKSSGTKFKLSAITFSGGIKISPAVKIVSSNHVMSNIKSEVEYEIVANEVYTVTGVFQHLSLFGNSLTYLDASNLTFLKSLGCGDNQLTSLDVSKLINMGSLSCSKNQLTSLDLSGLKKLEYIECDFNKLIDIKNQDVSFPKAFSAYNQTIVVNMKIDEKGEYISEDSYPIAEGHNINLPNEISFENGYFKCSEIPSEDVTFSTNLGWDNKEIKGKLKFGVKQSFTFKSSGTKFKLGEEMSSIGEIKISPSVKNADGSETTIIQKDDEYKIDANKEYTVSGIIKVLDVIDNSLTSLDVSKLTELERLDCYRNQLTGLNVYNLTNLNYLDFGNNQLTSIGVSNLKNLKKLFCPNNKLTGLALSNLTNLERLDCYNNQITSLDLSKLTKLERLYCFGNKLTDLDLSKLINLERLNCSFNQLTDLDLSNLTNLENLYCHNNQFINLDVSKLKNLKRLDCYKNQLTNLDVSNLSKLSHLDFGNNQLTSLDVSNLTNLRILLCPNNQLTGLDLSSLKKLKRLVCYKNKLTSLEVSNLTNLERLVCYLNPLTSLDVSNLTNLSYFDFGDNQLTSLDVSNLTKLDTLLCPNNQLASLDISGSKTLKKLICKSNRLIDIKNKNAFLVSEFSGDMQIVVVRMKINQNEGYISKNSFEIADWHNINLTDGISIENGYFKCAELPSEGVTFSTDIGWGDKKIKGELKFEEYVEQQFTLSLSASPAEGGTVSGEGTYVEDTEVTAKATANAGFSFLGWFDGDSKVSDQLEYKFKLIKNTNLIAKFEKKITPISVSISGKKNITGNIALKDQQFEFELYNDNTLVKSAKNNAEGKFILTISDLTEGTYNYTLKEKNDNQTGYTYDTKVYAVSIIVSKNTTNDLTHVITIKDGENIVETPEFTNSYKDTGISEFNADSQIKLYPNPVNDVLQIESLEIIKEITLSDISGKILITQLVNDTYFSLPTAQLNAGIYIIRLQTAKGLEYRKIIKE